MFWLASHGLAMLALKHPPVHLCVHVGPTPIKVSSESLAATMIHSQKGLI